MQVSTYLSTARYTRDVEELTFCSRKKNKKIDYDIKVLQCVLRVSTAQRL